MPTIHDTSTSSFKLYGFPVAHSAAPALHSTIFAGLGQDKLFSLFSTSTVTQEMIDDIKSEEWGGCA
jgi:quinate dehydrogenase